MLPAGWKKVEATRALIEYGRKQSHPRMLGHLFTTWGIKKVELTEYPPLLEGLKLMTWATSRRGGPARLLCGTSAHLVTQN